MLDYPQILCKIVEDTPIDRELLMMMRMVTEQLDDNTYVGVELDSVANLKEFDIGILVAFNDVINNQSNDEFCIETLFALAGYCENYRTLKKCLEDRQCLTSMQTYQRLVSTLNP